MGKSEGLTDAARAVLDEMKRQGCSSKDINRFYLDHCEGGGSGKGKAPLANGGSIRVADIVRKKVSLLACYEDARRRFTIFHIMNYIMYTEALEAFDMMEAEGLMRQGIKHNRKVCESEWARYQKAIRTVNDDADWYLLQDTCMAAHESVCSDLERLRMTFGNYLMKIKAPRHTLLAQLSVALKFADLILRLWPMYFKAYKNYCGRDLSKEFFYGDMHLFIHHLRNITDKLTLHCPKIDYSQDVNCNNTMAVLEYKMAEDSFIRDAVRTAMQYSDKYRSQQEETEQKQETK